MRFPLKTFGLLLASLALSSCGGGGGDGGGATSPPASGTITLTATRTTLPLNPNNILPYPGSPYMAEVSFSFRNANGAITALTSDATFTTSSPSTVSLSPPDDPSTDDINELATRVVSFPATTNNGSYVFFATSYDVAGTATVTASATDPLTNRTVTKTLVFTVAGASPVPASIIATPSPSGIYVQGSGGNTSSTISAQVRDGANQPVPDPGSVDNVRYEIIGNAGGAVLSGTSGSPSTTVTARTVNGIARVSFQSGTTLPPSNPVQIRVTVDRADNNVSNGIADPITATTSVVVSDGKLFGLVITSPDIDAITQNLVYSGVDADGVPVGAPNGTYSFTISALATDRQGNPVIPNTNIQFGVVDEPLTGFPGTGGGTFQISGGDGDPVEGSTGFTAPSGQFRTAGGGAGPGDTLLVFGQLVTGNSDLENIRIVQSVSTNTSLNVTSPFNLNDTTTPGAPVNYGPVLPYVIGRAAEVNITSSATTNAIGVATTTINYPVSRLGKSAIVWAQGNAATSATVRTVGDIQPLRLPGVAPATLSVSPTPIVGNTTTQVRVCLADAFGSPILGADIAFGFHDLGLGTGRIDGISGAGVLANPTGLDGCTTATVVTSGISGDDDDAGVTFTAGGEPVDVPITAGGALVLQAFPSTVGGGATIGLRLTDGSGVGVANVQISGTCTGGPSITGPIAPTDASGNTQVGLSSGNLGIVCAGEVRTSGTCTFTAGGADGPSATVTVLGPIDDGDASPGVPGGCGP